jgi:hypothetical protein
MDFDRLAQFKYPRTSLLTPQQNDRLREKLLLCCESRKWRERDGEMSAITISNVPT